jgi:hypothetical protein
MVAGARLVGLVVCGLLLPRSAGAQPAPVTSRGDRKDPQTTECISAFEEGQGLEREGKLVAATTLSGLCSAQSCPALVRTDCGERRIRVDKAIPTISIVARDAEGKDVPATIRVDGASWESGGRSVPIDPGPHEVEYIVVSRSPIKSRITVHEGEKNRVVVLPAGPASASPSTPVPGQTGETPKTLVVVEEKPAVPIGAILLGVAGGLALTAGVGLFVLAEGERSDAEGQRARLAQMTPGPERDAAVRSEKSHSDAAENTTGMALVVGAAGLLLLGGAVAWYFLERPSSPRARLARQVFAVGGRAPGMGIRF